MIDSCLFLQVKLLSYCTPEVYDTVIIRYVSVSFILSRLQYVQSTGSDYDLNQNKLRQNKTEMLPVKELLYKSAFESQS